MARFMLSYHCKTHLSVQVLQILPELSNAVAFADLNAEALLVGHIGGKAAEALAPTATDSHQQSIATRLHQHSMDAANMQDCIPAQHSLFFSGVCFGLCDPVSLTLLLCSFGC